MKQETLNMLPVAGRISELFTSCLSQVPVRISFLPVVLLLFISCEKVIYLDLYTSTPKIVIQGNIYDEPGPYEVKISNSVNFDEASDYPPISGATVLLTDNTGQTEVLKESFPGSYKSSKMRAYAERTYSLSVKTGGKTFEAKSKMPTGVAIDTIYFSKSPFSGDKITTIKFQDPPFSKNYYRIIYFVNDVQQKEFYVLSDEIFQGTTIVYSLMPRGSEIKLFEGDKVTVWLESIDNGIYEYFRTAVTEGGQTASPSNPVSNISNGALGYFNACSVRIITAKVGK
jgi:hypothetical protein